MDSINSPEDDYDSYAEAQQEVWNEAPPGIWWEWWLERPHPDSRVSAAQSALEDLVHLGCPRVELLFHLKDIASAGLSGPFGGGKLDRHIQDLHKMEGRVLGVRMTQMMADQEVRDSAAALADALQKHLAACERLKPALYRRQHGLRDRRIDELRHFVRTHTRGYHHKPIADLLSVALMEHFDDAVFG